MSWPALRWSHLYWQPASWIIWWIRPTNFSSPCASCRCRAICRRLGRHPRAKREAVAHALGKAWKSPLKTAGFSINASGFPQVISAIRALQPLTRTASEEVERHLEFPLGALFGAHAVFMKESRVPTSVFTAALDVVEILVRQPAEPSHLGAVPMDSTVRHVKEVFAENWTGQRSPSTGVSWRPRIKFLCLTAIPWATRVPSERNR